MDTLPPGAAQALHSLAPPQLLALLDKVGGLGWTLKAAPLLQHLALGGELPPHLQASPLGRTDTDLLPSIEAAALRQSDLKALRLNQPTTEQHRLEPPNFQHEDQVLAYRVHRLPFACPQHGPCLLSLWVNHSQAQRQQRQEAAWVQQLEQLQHQLTRVQSRLHLPDGHHSSHDGLAAALAQVRREIDLTRREQRLFCLLVVQLCTQHLPPEAWAPAQLQVGEWLRQGTRAMDTVLQVGPTQHAVVLSGAPLAPAYHRAQALRAHIHAQVVVHQGQPLPLRVGIGVAACPHTADEATTLWEAAQHAAAKGTERGGDCVMAGMAMTRP